jgi:hypothetical protein
MANDCIAFSIMLLLGELTISEGDDNGAFCWVFKNPEVEQDEEKEAAAGLLLLDALAPLLLIL